MLRPLPAAIWLIALALGSASGARPPYSIDSVSVLGRLEGAFITSIAQDARGAVIVAGTTKPRVTREVLRTNNMGAAWEPVAVPADVASVVPSPVDPAVLFGIGEQSIYKSPDAGRTWRKVSDAGALWLAVDPSDPRRVMATYEYRMLRSFDGGETWTERSMGALRAGSIHPDPSGSGAVVLRVENKSLWISHDWGQTLDWMPVPTNWGVDAFAFDPAHRGWMYAGSDTGLYFSSDFGRTWTQKTPQFPFHQLLVDPAGALYAVGQSIQRSTDGGVIWKPYGEGRPSVVQGVGCVQRGTIAAYSPTVSFSVDWGSAWTSPQFHDARSIAAGAGCSFYITRQLSPEGFVAKLGRDDVAEWTTYLGQSNIPLSLVPDASGNAYVAGNGSDGAKLTRLTPDGRIDFSTAIGAQMTALGIALDSARNVYLAGRRPAGAFLSKISPAGAVLASTDLPADPFGVVVDRDDRPVVAWRAEGATKVARWNAALSASLDSTEVEFADFGALAIDRDGNLILAGSRGGGPATTASCRIIQPYLTTMTLTVSKLAARDWSTLYRTTATAPCGIVVQSVTVDSGGAPIVAMGAGLGFPTAQPIYGGPTCQWMSGAVAKLSPDGSRIDFGSYLDTCAAPAVASSGGGLIVGAGDRVLRIDAPAAGPRIDAVANLFSGDPSAVVEGALVTLSTSGFTPATADLGLNRPDLPQSLSGVEVRFDGQPAQIVQTGPGRVVVVVPKRPHERGLRKGSTAIQLIFGGVPSNVVRMPVVNARPGILNFVVNADGTQNGPDHPARSGSTLTLFVTGIGNAAGSIYSTWQVYRPGQIPEPLAVEPVPGYLPAITQVKVPAAPFSLGRSVVGLRFSVPSSTTPIGESNYVTVYVN